MLVEPCDILSAISLTHAEERETFILVLFSLLLRQCVIPYLLCSLLPLLLSFVLYLALFISARLLLYQVKPFPEQDWEYLAFSIISL